MAWMVRRAFLFLLIPLIAACVSGSRTAPPDREWAKLTTDYAWIEQLRRSAPLPEAGASRAQQIEVLLANQRKLEPVWVPFMDRLRDYWDRTRDPRAGALYAREKIAMGDVYMNVLSRYDRAIALYRTALETDPENPTARARIAEAESRRFVSPEAFNRIQPSMDEAKVREILGFPREDWIKQVVQRGRTYSVWIYPKEDGGAAAVYFDSGVVYHTNWNAAQASQEREGVSHE